MKCHNCQAKTEVEETRVIEENPRWTKRRRVCKNCGFTLWTVEMPAEDVVVKEKYDTCIAERQTGFVFGSGAQNVRHVEKIIK
jgi:transcriptional regulator NrdR family protein